MKKTIYLCNQCGREIKTEGTRIIPHFYDFSNSVLLEHMEVPDDDVHFCMKCTKEIMEELFWMPEGEEKTSGEAQGKKRRPRKEERLDAGKVMALHKAGWSNEQIADEMGVGERQIYQCVRYQKKKIAVALEESGDGEEQEIEEQL